MVHLYQAGDKRFEVFVNKLTLREYRPGDDAAMYALDVLCFAPEFRFSRRAMRGFAESRGACVLLAESPASSHTASALAGFCIVQREGHTGYVVTLDVAEAWRRSGLARHMMQEIEAQVCAAGIETMALHVFTGNDAAIHFYESIGYTRTGMAHDFYRRGLDAWVYEKTLAPCGTQKRD